MREHGSFAQQIRAGKLAATSTDPISDYQEFASQLLRLAGEELFLAESDAKPA